MTETASAGATPAVGGATPSQTTPVSPAATAFSTDAQDTSATDDQALGDSGKRALDRMKAERDADRAARRTLEQELADLKAAGQSDHEKAIAQAKKDGAKEVLDKVQSQIRRSEVRSALTAAGLPANLIDLAARADEFGALKVSDDGTVDGLPGAIDAFRKAQPALFQAARPSGDAGLGPRGTPPGSGRDMNDLIRQATGRR